MNGRSETDWPTLRRQVLGLGEDSLHKSHYASLRQRMAQLERFRRLLDSSSDLLFIVEVPSGRILDANRTACERLGVPLAEVNSRSLEQLFPPQDWFELARAWQSAEAPSIPHPMALSQLRTADGGLLPVEIAITPVESGGARYTVLAARDTSERQSAEQALQKSQELLAEGERVAQWGSWEWDIIPDRLYLSAGLKRMIGLQPDEPGLTFQIIEQRVIHSDDILKFRSCIEQCLRDGQPWDLEFRIFRQDTGEVRFWHGLGEGVKDKTGRVIRVIGTDQDITERKRAEEEKNRLFEQLLQSQKMEALGQFAGGLAHDFNNLLTVINGYTFLMLKGLIPEHPMRAELEAVLQAGKHAAVLTSQFLAFSRRQILQPKMVDLNKVVTGNQPMLRRLIGEQIELSANLDPALGVVEADPVQLEQVIMNLSSNARDAMPLGGKLILETSNVFVDKEQYSGSPLEVPPGSYALLTVRDTGTGMSEDVKSRIFEPFFTTKERGKGTGLGLSTAYGTVKQSGGHIVVDSKPGSGTIFKIYLPTATVAETAAESQQQERPFLNGTEVVLVAEDEKDVRKLICESLRTFGYRVLEAGDGAEVLSVCEWQKGPIQLLVTDVVMPGMPVSEMVSQIRRVRPETKVLYMSGYMDDVVLGSLGPGTSFLQKPFTPEVLAARIRELLTAPREDNTDNRSMEHKT